MFGRVTNAGVLAGIKGQPDPVARGKHSYAEAAQNGPLPVDAVGSTLCEAEQPTRPILDLGK